MTFQQLTYFLAAAEHGSFSAAAESLFMAQPSLSEQIRRLEAELGVPLFARVGRGLELTEAGRLLRPHAERTLAAAQRGRRVGAARCATSPAAPSPSARSAAPTTTCSAAWSQDFRTPPPERARARHRPELGRGRRRGPRRARSRPAWSSCRSTTAGSTCAPAMREELLYVSADPERVREPMTIERLADAPLILYDARWGADDPTRRQLRERAQRGGRARSSRRSRSST